MQLIATSVLNGPSLKTERVINITKYTCDQGFHQLLNLEGSNSGLLKISGLSWIF